MISTRSSTEKLITNTLCSLKNIQFLFKCIFYTAGSLAIIRNYKLQSIRTNQALLDYFVIQRNLPMSLNCTRIFLYVIDCSNLSIQFSLLTSSPLFCYTGYFM